MSPEPIIILGPKTMRRVLAPAPRRRVLAVVGALSLAAIAITAVIFHPANPGPTVVAKRGDIVHSLVGLGRVEADRTIEIAPRIAARIREIHVQEGDRVEAGQPLVTLEDDAIRAQHDEAARARDAAKARRDEVARGTRPEDLDRAKARVAEAEHAQAAADAKLAEVLRGPRTEEKEAAEAALVAAQSDADHAAKEYERMQSLAEKGAVALRDRDEAKRKHDVAQAALRQARARHEMCARGATDEEKAQARGTAEAAKSRVEQERAGLARLTKGATDEELRAAEAEFARAEAALSRIAFELAQTKIASPVAGTVARRYKEPSELASPAMEKPVLVIAADDLRVVRIEVIETDIYKLRLGQAAVITSEAAPGRRWTGKVTRIAPAMGRKALFSEHPKEWIDVKVLEVRVTPDERLDLPISAPAEARIAETAAQGVVMIPVRALAGDSAKLPDGSVRKLTLGARDDGFVEVVSGLAEGERVVLP